MTEEKLVKLAAIAIRKKYEYETMKYSDYLYGNEGEIENVWKYVEECEEIGTTAFKEKYKQYQFIL